MTNDDPHAHLNDLLLTLKAWAESRIRNHKEFLARRPCASGWDGEEHQVQGAQSALEDLLDEIRHWEASADHGTVAEPLPCQNMNQRYGLCAKCTGFAVETILASGVKVTHHLDDNGKVILKRHVAQLGMRSPCT